MTPAHVFDLVAVIDDDVVDRRLAERAILRSGVARAVLTFSGGEAALGWLGAHGADSVDLLFLDIRMPRMDGFEFLEALEARHGACAAVSVIIMLTTSLDPSDRVRAESCALVKDYLNKPLVVEMLERIARRR